jgi:hypothetical protein
LELHCPKSDLNFWQILAQASKIGQITKINTHYCTNWGYLLLIIIKGLYLFLIWHILEARAEICQKFMLLFGQWSFKKKWFSDLLTFRNFIA